MGRHLDFAYRGELVEGGRWRSDLLDDDGDVHMGHVGMSSCV